MSLGSRVRELREGFQTSFWVANFSELFERLAFYAQQAFLSLFLIEKVKLSDVAASNLMGWFGLVVYALPVLVGSLADRFGFRRALAAAYLFAGAGYFLLGSFSASWMAPFRSALPAYWLIFIILMITAIGPALVKPSVAGTVAITSSEQTRSLGYSIYYTLVNIGGAVGPLAGAAVVGAFAMETDFRFAAFCVFAMFAVILIFFREPRREDTGSVTSVRQALTNTLLVLRNWRFVLFLLIFSGYWVTFYAFWVVMPIYLHRYAPGMSDATIGRVLSVDALMIICFQVLVSYFTRRVSIFTALTAGVVLATLSMLTMSAPPSLWVAVAAMIVFSLGEMTQAPRFYEYVSRLAPKGQEGVFLGYAFLPIALGYFIAGQIGGHLLHYFGEVLNRPTHLWRFLAGVGFVTAILMALYNRVFVAPRAGQS